MKTNKKRGVNSPAQAGRLQSLAIVLSIDDQDAPFHFHGSAPFLVFNDLGINEFAEQNPDGFPAIKRFPFTKVCSQCVKIIFEAIGTEDGHSARAESFL